MNPCMELAVPIMTRLRLKELVAGDVKFLQGSRANNEGWYVFDLDETRAKEFLKNPLPVEEEEEEEEVSSSVPLPRRLYR